MIGKAPALLRIGLAPQAEEHATTSNPTSQLEISVELDSHPVVTGSFGDVYRSIVESNVGRVEVAVKVFKVDHCTKTVEKLRKTMLREIIVWLRLNHPNILPLLGVARVESPFLALVSRWMPSGTLYEWLDKQATTITSSTRAALVEGIAQGLDYLHSENVIHGDLHPGNVLIDDSGNPCLTDFGLATVAEDPELQWTLSTMQRNFDSRWRAPEVVGIDGDPMKPTFKSDIFSFGSLMFFIFSGTIPWKGKNSSQVSINLLQGNTPSRPHNVFDYHWDLIQECWTWKSGDRPDATKLLRVIAKHRQETLTSYGPSKLAPPGRQETICKSIIIDFCERLLAKNIILFGEPGTGKSSVVNLLAGKEMAKTSLGTECCTQHWGEHLIMLDEHYYKVFDTVGLNDPSHGIKEHLDAIMNAFHLISTLCTQGGGGIDLLLFCVRAGSITPAFRSNYLFFCERLCARKIPVVVVLTGLEGEQRMED